jgi:hypothetical protein
VLGEQGVSIKSVVQRARRERAAGDGHPPGARVALRAAMELLAELDFVRSPPRAIRVIEEEFVMRTSRPSSRFPG